MPTWRELLGTAPGTRYCGGCWGIQPDGICEGKVEGMADGNPEGSPAGMPGCPGCAGGGCAG
ncbi:MAG: hypothetical protein KC766_38365 [Myxococcales bacterium]|nr:hypothetical protein [Myxococcales bacterium]